MEYVNIIGHDNLIRDLHSKAILETNMNSVENYNRQRKVFEDSQKTKDEISELKQEVSEIKEMFKELLRKLNQN